MLDISLPSFFSTWSLVVTVLLLYLYNWYKRPKNFPPGPRGIPALGVLPFMGKYPERAIKKWSKTYGPVLSVRFGTQDVVMLNDLESVQQANVKHATKFSGRHQSTYLLQFTEGLGLIFRDYSEHWRVQRKFGHAALRGAGFGKRSLEERIVEETSFLIDAVNKEDGKAFDINRLLHNAVSNIICGVGFGRRFDYDDARFKDILHRLIFTFEDPVSSAMGMVFMFAPSILIKIPPFSFFNDRLVKDVKESMVLLDEIIKENESTFDEKDVRNFIDAFLFEMKKKTNDSFTRKQLMQYVRDLFQAGSESVATTLRWSLLCLLHYPQVQRKLREEIMNVIGLEGYVSFEKRSEMPYTVAFMEEILRFRAPTPLGVLHTATEDAELGGYFIPKGTQLMTNLWAVHNDEATWKHPETFNPDRFLNEKGNFVRSSYAIPFSVGPRSCMGEQLARTELFIFLVSLVRRFEFLPDPNAEKLPEIDGGIHGVFFAPKPYKVVAREL